MTITIGRRELLAALGGAAVWPLAARAQQREKMRRVGVLSTVSPAIPWGKAAIDALAQGLSALGWKEGHNLQIDWRFWGGINSASMGRDAAQLVALEPDVLLAVGAALGSLSKRSRTLATN